MTGADALASMNGLYDVAGQIRATLIELQAQVRIASEADNAKGR
jgi:hypothetical protein